MNSLGIDKSPAETRVVVAMSGGVDSSVTAALLREQGYEVVGVTLQLYDHGVAVRRKGACCAGQDIYDARAVADRLGIPHYVLDYENRFRDSVIEDFIDSYVRGETPLPCVRCNQTVKFRDLLATAHDLEADVLATGHYVRRKVKDNTPQLWAGADPKKDQSYFLFATTLDQLDFLRFPLGGLSKSETRRFAIRFGLPVADKPDSQDICFVPEGNYAAIVKKLRPAAERSGNIVHVDGTVLGRHNGLIHYTIGQRRGLGIGGRQTGAGADTEPLYVVRLEPDNNQIIVGPHSELAISDLQLTNVNWLGEQRLSDGPVSVTVKIRSTMTPVPAVVDTTPEGDVTVRFEQPQYGVSPGQACVFYRGDWMLGGGWIVRKAQAGSVE